MIIITAITIKGIKLARKPSAANAGHSEPNIVIDTFNAVGDAGRALPATQLR
jgi:hypothetical protein